MEISKSRTGALFSECKDYRYALWRIWDDSKPLLGFCMLNPSTADESTNDPTVERCQRRAEMLGYGGIVVTNLFAYRSTDPNVLRNVPDPIGYFNDKHILDCAQLCKVTICGWGKHGSLNNRGRKTIEYLKFMGIKVRALKVNKDGSPAHPLYIGYKIKPKAL